MTCLGIDFFNPTAAAIPFLQGGVGAVTRTSQNKMRERVSIFDYYSVLDADYTNAMVRATTYLVDTFGGGTIVLPQVQDYPMNWVCEDSYIGVEMVGGDAMNNTNCIRPADLSSPPVTFGKAGTFVRSNFLVNCNISGCSTHVNADSQSAYSAPAALFFTCGVVNFEQRGSYFFNGLRTIKMVPEAVFGSGITGIKFFGGAIRNDLTDNANSRAVYEIRLGADTGYLTNVVYFGTKINGVAGGNVAEFDGCNFEGFGTYIDLKDGHGVLLKNSAGLVGYRCNLDAGIDNAIVVETDDPTLTDPTRILFGNWDHGIAKWKNGSGTEFALAPSGTDFLYEPTIRQPFIRFPMYIGTALDAQSTAAYWDLDTNDGPISLFGLAMRLRDETQSMDLTTGSFRTEGGAAIKKKLTVGEAISIYGANAFASAVLNALSVDGGLDIEAIGDSIRVSPPAGKRFISQSPIQAAQDTKANILANYDPANYPWCHMYASDGAGNKKLVFSDGGTWRYPDGTAVV